MGFESAAVPGLLQFPQQHMPGARTDLGAELARQSAGGDTDNPHAPCKRCGGLGGVHYLTCPLLRRPGQPEPLR
jgi:hypothetical protein